MDRTLRGRVPASSATLPLLHVGLGAVGTGVTWEAKRKQLIAISGARDLSAAQNSITFSSLTPHRHCSSYYTTINIGGQPFNIALDTGSADLVTEFPLFLQEQLHRTICSGFKHNIAR